ncbi:hypothetical protein [Arthrobacter gengyunqii]|uniref:Uncharacterized protein n=1 Tax=Arthrobacter gengyunqii TaxID=2886940 RepID=A0ABS8GKU1_9MICC|nr:hypothetical protein [Arthrobacter gengyunqii]MCC3267294.1 hypothetical protein [Arthrobacter gengyunqii]
MMVVFQGFDGRFCPSGPISVAFVFWPLRKQRPRNVDSAADLNAGQVYSGHARDKMPWETESGDQWAWIGRDTSRDHKVNPMDFEFGSHAFGTDTGGDAGRIVTDHSTLMSDNGAQAGYLDKGTEPLKIRPGQLKGKWS